MQAKDVLPDTLNQIALDGVTVRKGTVAAFMGNIRILQHSTSRTERDRAASDMVIQLPAIVALGLLDIFEIRDQNIRQWVAMAREQLGVVA